MATEAARQQTQLYWLALHLVPGLGARNALKLIRQFGDPERIFHASLTELESCGLPHAVARSIHSGTTFEDASAEAERAASKGIGIVPIQDPRYPQRLKEIFDPPILLYARGDAALLAGHAVGVVGSRRPTPYGTAVARKLGKDLAEEGLTVISGMARGVDSNAHWGALDSTGRTVAVLGCGVDVVYPKENAKLADEIAARGVIVSEFPLGSTAFPQNFPIRNRVISGLSMGILVVEGAQYSGSLITARLALDQSREVFAVPGNITNKLSWGPNLLIKQGAKLVQEAMDVVEELPTDVRQELALQRGESRRLAENAGVNGQPNAGQGTLFSDAASPLGKQLLALLRVDNALHIDEIIRQVETRSSSEVLASLSEMELYGVVKQLPGKHFVKVWSS